MKIASFIAMSVVAAAATVTSAAVFTVTPNTADGLVVSGRTSPTDNGVQDTGDYAARIGEYFNPGQTNYVAGFVLPTLAAGEVVTGATLRTQVFGQVGTPASIDLYGIGARSDPSPLATDFYIGTGDSSKTLIQAAYITAASPVSTTNFAMTSTSGSSALVDYLNSLYTGGATGGQYAFLRYSPEGSVATNSATTVLTANAGGSTERPLLTITTGAAVTPEPASLSLLALGSLAALRRSRR